MSPEDTTGSIEMAFGMWGGMGPINHVLDGGPDPPRETGMPAVSIFNSTMRRFIELL